MNHSDHHRTRSVHAHTHGTVDPALATTERGIWAVKWSFMALTLTAILQIIVVYLTHSVALMADTIHNIGDATTAVPLWIAFALAQRKPSPRFPYGLGRVEDFAGVVVLLTILASAIAAGYESIDRFLHPRPMEHLPIVAAAAMVGFLGNELVAVFRIRVGKEIKSAALVADGYHARVDGLASLGVLAGVAGVWLGYPMADPIVGILITLTILRIVWDSGKSILPRLLDAVDPEVINEIHHALAHVDGISQVADVRARWLGHRMHAEISIGVKPELQVTQGHVIAMEARHQLMHHLPYLSSVAVHVDPDHIVGGGHHSVAAHSHGNSTNHSHP